LPLPSPPNPGTSSYAPGPTPLWAWPEVSAESYHTPPGPESVTKAELPSREYTIPGLLAIYIVIPAHRGGLVIARGEHGCRALAFPKEGGLVQD
jgi:hypothetical protein